jgi:hypothetical protein
MAARFNALSDNEIAASGLGGSALVDRADLPRNEGTSTMAGSDKALVTSSLEELDDPYPPSRFRYDLDRRQVRDQEADPRGAAFRRGWLDTVRNHAEAAFGGDRRGKFGCPDAAEHRELEGQSATDQLSEARVH